MKNISAKKKQLEKEIEQLNSDRKYYVLQSEFHKRMYALNLKKELLDEISKQ